MTTVVLQTPTRSRRTVHFLRHLLEMTLAMFVGMGALAAILAAVGISLLDFRLAHPEAAVAAMLAAMTIPMVAWMRHRGHDWRSDAEMSAAMAVPAIVVLVCYWLGGVSAEPICPLMCGGMIPAMSIAMLLRVDRYTQPHRRSAVVS